MQIHVVLALDSYGILLPYDLPPGQYGMVMGLYRPDVGGERVRVVGGGEYISLPDVTVVADASDACRATGQEPEVR